MSQSLSKTGLQFVAIMAAKLNTKNKKKHDSFLRNTSSGQTDWHIGSQIGRQSAIMAS